MITFRLIQLGSDIYNLSQGQILIRDQNYNLFLSMTVLLHQFYLNFENKDNNELFKHIKSFEYSLRENYHKLLKILNHDEFQIQIFGHSCGVSDRTLLNQIFLSYQTPPPPPPTLLQRNRVLGREPSRRSVSVTACAIEKVW